MGAVTPAPPPHTAVRPSAPLELARWPLACAIFAALAAALFAPVLLDGRTLAPGDATLYYYPHYVARHWLWTPALYSGYPVFADPQAMTWYPPAMLLGAIPGSWNLFVVLAYAVAGGSMFCFVLRLTGSRSAGAASGVVYAGSGFAVAHLEHTSILHTYAWAPLVLWSLEELRRSPSSRWLALGAVATALAALAGHPQVFAYLGLVALGYALLPAPQQGGGWPDRMRPIAALVLGVGMASVLFVPMLALAGESVRSAGAPGRAFDVSLAPHQLPQLLFPFLYGGQAHVVGLGPGTYTGGDSWIESTGFVGLVPLALAGLAIWLRPRRAEVRFFAVATLLALAVCVGDALPFAKLLALLPGLDRFRVPARLLFVTTLSLSVLAGIGLQALWALPRPQRSRTLRRAVLILGGVGAIAWLGAATTSDRAGGIRASPLLLLQVGSAALAAALLFLACRYARPAVRMAFVAGLALELASVAAFAPWRDSPKASEAFAFPETLRGVHDDLARSRQRSVTLSAFGPLETAPPNRNQIWEIPSVIGYGPLPLARYADLLRLAPAGHLGRADELARVLGPNDRSLDLLATRYLLVPGVTRPGARPDLFQPTRALVERSGRWRLHAVHRGVSVYENLHALPRAWIAGELRAVGSDEVVDAIRRGRLRDGTRFDPTRTALVEEEAQPLSCPAPCGNAEIVSLVDTQMVVRTRARSGAMLVLSDVAYPGWQALVDGEPAPIVRTDFVLRGVRVPAGEHRVALSFRPRSLLLGVGLSVLCAVSLALWCSRAARRHAAASGAVSPPPPSRSTP